MQGTAEPEPSGAALPLGGGRLPAHLRDSHGLHLRQRAQQATGIHHLPEERRFSTAREPRAGWRAPGPARSTPRTSAPIPPGQRRQQGAARPHLQPNRCPSRAPAGPERYLTWISPRRQMKFSSSWLPGGREKLTKRACRRQPRRFTS